MPIFKEEINETVYLASDCWTGAGGPAHGCLQQWTSHNGTDFFSSSPTRHDLCTPTCAPGARTDYRCTCASASSTAYHATSSSHSRTLDASTTATPYQGSCGY